MSETAEPVTRRRTRATARLLPTDRRPVIDPGVLPLRMVEPLA